MLGLSAVSCDNTVIVHLGQEYQRPNVPVCNLGMWRRLVSSQGTVTWVARGRWYLLAFSTLKLPFFPF